MQTFLSPQQHPYVKISISGRTKEVELDCLIDTGFAGGISIPAGLKSKFDFPVIGRQVWELADGSQIELEVFLGEIKTEKEKAEIAVIFTDGSEGLVGIEFLRGRKFIFDLRKLQVALK